MALIKLPELIGDPYQPSSIPETNFEKVGGVFLEAELVSDNVKSLAESEFVSNDLRDFMKEKIYKSEKYIIAEKLIRELLDRKNDDVLFEKIFDIDKRKINFLRYYDLPRIYRSDDNLLSRDNYEKLVIQPLTKLVEEQQTINELYTKIISKFDVFRYLERHSSFDGIITRIDDNFNDDYDFEKYFILNLETIFSNNFEYLSIRKPVLIEEFLQVLFLREELICFKNYLSETINNQVEKIKLKGYSLDRYQRFQKVNTETIPYDDKRTIQVEITEEITDQTEKTMEQTIGTEFHLGMGNEISVNTSLEIPSMSQDLGAKISINTDVKTSESNKTTDKSNRTNKTSRKITETREMNGGEKGARVVVWQLVDEFILTRIYDNEVISKKTIQSSMQMCKYEYESKH